LRIVAAEVVIDQMAAVGAAGEWWSARTPWISGAVADQ
jgi:hypothetical protein